MSSENWKIEKDLCRCCHSEGSFKNLAEPVGTTGISEIYADMLNECFDIDMAPMPGLLSAATYTICEVCVIRLRDASDFKKQVLVCEERFKDLYNRNGITVAAANVPMIDVEVKQEVLDSEPDDDFKMESAQDDNNDEEYTVRDESIELKLSEEEEEQPPEVEVRKKRKNKPRKTVPCKTSKKTKPQNEKEQNADEENDAEKKQGRDEAPKFQLNEDYKKVGDIYQCLRCDKTFEKHHCVRRHLRTIHYKIPRYKCSICNDRFANEVRVTVHKLEAHNVDVRKTCRLCKRIFNTNANLQAHIRDFHKLGDVGEIYKCEFCDYTAIKYVDFRRHQVVHSTEKNHHCSFCQKSFKRKKTLDSHLKIHTGERNKVCTICGQAFVQKASLNYHMTKYHPEVKF